jgi:hypothetical protein
MRCAIACEVNASPHLVEDPSEAAPLALADEPSLQHNFTLKYFCAQIDIF